MFGPSNLTIYFKYHKPIYLWSAYWLPYIQPIWQHASSCHASSDIFGEYLLIDKWLCTHGRFYIQENVTFLQIETSYYAIIQDL